MEFYEYEFLLFLQEIPESNYYFMLIQIFWEFFSTKENIRFFASKFKPRENFAVIKDKMVINDNCGKLDPTVNYVIVWRATTLWFFYMILCNFFLLVVNSRVLGNQRWTSREFLEINITVFLDF